MRFLRSNTAVIITVGPFLDKTDGVVIETALTITNEKITLTADTDAGSAPTNILDNVTGATSGTSNDLNYITGNDAGLMQLELAAADVNRVGRMFLTITDAANHVPVFHELFVLPAAIYDWLTGVIVPLPANVTTLLGTAWLTPGTAGTPDVNTKLAGGTAWGSGAITAASIASDAITDAKVASDVTIASVTGAVGSVSGAVGSVTGAVGSVTGAVGSVTGLTAATVHSDLDDIQARLPAALTAGGNMKAGVQGFLDTVFTEGAAGRIAAAFKQFFNIATPAATMDHGILTDTVTTTTTATTATNLTNAPTSGDFTTTMKTSIGTAVAASAVASVTGAVASVTGNVGGNVVGTVGSVVGAVGSVTGAVGSVTGAVGSVTAGVTVTTNNDKTGYALTSGERTSVADALLDRDMSTGTDSGSPSVRTVRQALRFLRNKWAIAAGTLTVRKEDDTTASWTATVTTTAGDPVSTVDPA